MCEEIRQQPEAIERTLSAEWPQAEKLRREFEARKIDLVILAARGTSDNAAQFGRYLLEITTGIPVSLAAPSILTLYHSDLRMKNALVVAISQSGESTDTNAVLESARGAGALTVGITNESESALARIAEHTLLVRAGREKSVAATKTYTGQLTCLYLLAYALGAPITRDQLNRLPDWTASALRLESEINTRAERYCFMKHAVCIGRGLNYANSFEFALKLMETSYVVAERFSSADLLHGPIAMLETAFPAFLFCPSGVTWKPMSEMLGKLREIGAESLVITDESNAAVDTNHKAKSAALTIPANLSASQTSNGKDLPEDLFTPIPYIIPAQLFAAKLAEVKHLDPDRPRTLNKVTQTL